MMKPTDRNFDGHFRFRRRSLANSMLVCVLEPEKDPFGAIVLLAKPNGEPIMAYDLGLDGYGSLFFYQFSEPNFWHYISPDDKHRKQWHRAVDAWTRCSDNDCLRARGDARWQAACTFEMQTRE